MVSKRKRVLEDFDPNQSDPEDENFDPAVAGPPRKTTRKAGRSRSGRSGRRHRTGYGGSDIDDDEDEVSDSNEDDFLEDDDEEDDDDEEGAPVNAAGRRARKAATKHTSYIESSDEDASSTGDEPDRAGKDDVKSDEDEDIKEDDAEGEPAEEPVRSTRSRVVKLKLSNNKIPVPRRTTRAHTEDAEEFLELSNSGKHAVPSRDSRSRSPETYARTARTTRGFKGLKNAPETIQEATQESSFRRDAEEPDELSQDHEDIQKKENVDEDMQDAADVDAPGEDAPVQTVEDDDDEDDVPITRRTRGTRANASVQPEEVESDVNPRKSRRLTRKSSKKSQEVSSDFEPGDESDDAEVSGEEKSRPQDVDDVDSPIPRGRRSRPARSRRGGESGDEEPEFDMDELNEEARELRQDSRSRRRRPRKESPIVYQENTRRARARVNYYMPPLTSANIEEEEVEVPTTQSRARRGRGGASQGWERSLNTTFGPFGGGGAGALLNGPWGTGAAGGVDSDSSDDEMVHRSSVVGNVGMTPTSAAPGGLLPGAPGHNLEGAGAAPNVGKIKDRKALADADPLGVDLNVDFSKVGGLQGHIDQLKEMVQLPLLYPELFTRFHVTPPRGVLFHGPPGTGKTLLARALANSVGSGGRKISFYMRKGADALSKWVGEAEKQLRLLFEEARRTQPSIIFFDEIDGLAPVRSSKQEQIHASIVSTLLALMDGMDGRGQVIVIGATNRPDNIDPALRRPGRFDREFYFPLPDIEGRKSILDIHTADWGLSDQFKNSLAENTKGYGGADLRALCTEASLNAIQRTYPQIYASTEKLVVDPEKISVHATDFMLSIKKLIPSSERSATSGAKPLPKSIDPLLRNQLADAKMALDGLLPRKKKLTALQEAMYEQYDDDDHGFGREAMQQEFERSRIFRPRFIIYGAGGMGHSYISSAILHYFEGVHVQNFDLPSILADGRSMEQVIVGLFTEVRRHKPSVIYIPNIEAWYTMLQGTLALVTFKTMLRSIPPSDPVLLLATAEGERNELPNELFTDFFGFSRKNQMKIEKPDEMSRMEYFSTTLQYAKKKPREFPDPENRKKRVLEELPIAPPVVPPPPTKADIKAAQKRDHQLLNTLKISLQPIMDQINRRYKKFRQPVIPPAQIEYLFVESDPNYVRPDLATGQLRPYEIVKDKYDNDVLRDNLTGKCYYNLETTTIEERLSNGFYARPKDFLFDIKALARDAKNIGDKERTLKANELLSNVEVDVASIEMQTSQVDWEALYRRQIQRAKEVAEKERKRKAMQSLVDRVQSDLGGNDSDSQGPVTLGEAVPGSRTMARFQVRSPLSNGHDISSQDLHPLSNGVTGPEDIEMSGFDDTQAISEMGPPPKSHDQTSAVQAGMTQISQKSVVTTLPPGVSPSAVINEASTTKTSDPSTHRSSNFSQMTNGGHAENRGVDDDSQVDIPDTLLIAGHNTSGEDSWLHSQAQAQAAAGGNVMPGSQVSVSPSSQRTTSQFKAQTVGGMANILNENNSDEHPSVRNSGSSTSASQPFTAGEVDGFLQNVTESTSGCTIEQLEQINRELMDEIWRTRNEWNRSRVLDQVVAVFNRTMEDIEAYQGMGPPSQIRNY
ncbi:26S proteasome subunit [Fusarium heterosporum]|uniref:26S proteasome subunit n=1 Tax=Fusarium heterosporum TaxID=42747 RepID=A0A8H5T1U0_FUSHE|nr:26S proteasome subunit [Fusarium heterosporum]